MSKADPPMPDAFPSWPHEGEQEGRIRTSVPAASPSPSSSPSPSPSPSPSLSSSSTSTSTSSPPVNSTLLPTIAAPPQPQGHVPMYQQPIQAPIQQHYIPQPAPMPTTICPYCSMQLAYPHGASLIICPGCRRTSQLTVVPRLQLNCNRCTTLLYYAPVYQLIQCPTCQLVIQPPHVQQQQSLSQPPPQYITTNPQLRIHHPNPSQPGTLPTPAPAPVPTPSTYASPSSSSSSSSSTSLPPKQITPITTPRPPHEGKDRDEWDLRHGMNVEMKDMTGRSVAVDDVDVQVDESKAPKSSIVESLKKQQAKKKAQNGGYQALLADDD